MAEAGQQGQQGQQSQQGSAVTAVQARELLADLYPDPAILQGLDDTRVLEIHGKAAGKFKPTSAWGEDWRDRIAANNPDFKKTLERFPTPVELAQSYQSLRQQRDSGELRSVKPYPAQGTADEQSAWRKDNGVPNAPTEYKIELPTGTVLGEDDKPIVDKFLQHAHQSNLPQSAVSATIGWWAQEKLAREESAAQNVSKLETETQDALRTEWGNDYTGNMNRIKGLVQATVPGQNKELVDSIMGAIRQNADFARHYATLAYQLNPAGAMVPGDGRDAQSTIQDQIVAIEKTMGTDAYTKDEKQQAKLRELYGAYERLAGHSWDKRPKK